MRTLLQWLIASTGNLEVAKTRRQIVVACSDWHTAKTWSIHGPRHCIGLIQIRMTVRDVRLEGNSVNL